MKKGNQEVDAKDIKKKVFMGTESQRLKYAHAVNNNTETGRDHSYKINNAFLTEQSIDFRAELQDLEGDGLKTKILQDFKKKIDEITDVDTLQQELSDLKASDDYKILKPGQGWFTRTFKLDTSSVKAVQDLVDERTSIIQSKPTNHPE